MKKLTGLLVIVAIIALNVNMGCKKVQQSNISETKSVNNYLNESQEKFNERMEWWRNAKFGMFIHWGGYSVLAGEYDGKKTNMIAEWIMNTEKIPIKSYEEYAKQFNPIKYNPEEWVKLAEEAGMKYIVVTSKHHDGFALWDSEVSKYDVMDFAPYKKDILKGLADACKKYNIKFGLYYSIMDWHHPKAQSINEPHYWNFDGENKSNPLFPEYFEGYLKPQIKELITNYDPEILWFDGEWIDDYTHDQGVALYQYIRTLKPSILVNNRVDKGRQGMMGMNGEGNFVGDFGTPEQEILDTPSEFDWESCMTMNDTWGYNKNDFNWKSSNDLIFNLVDVVSKGGNYLLNIGPTGEGLVPEASIERLKQMGEWMNVNSEAVYGTERLSSTYREGDSIRYTKRKNENLYYAIVFDPSDNSKIILKHIEPIEGTDIVALGYDKPLGWEYNEKTGLSISIPSESIFKMDDLKTVALKIQGKEIK